MGINNINQLLIFHDGEIRQCHVSVPFSMYTHIATVQGGKISLRDGKSTHSKLIRGPGCLSDVCCMA